MINVPWIDRLHDNQEIFLPIQIQNDCEYQNNLSEKFKKIIDILKVNDAPRDIVNSAIDSVNAIESAIDCYYKGNIVDAYSVVYNLIEKISEENTLAISSIQDGFSFPKRREGREELQLFRARLSNSATTYSPTEMLHIPFDQRSKVKSERFSIPGLPCLYLGSSTYICWLEMGCPPEYKFNVSPVTVDEKLRVLNLTYTLQNLYSVVDWVEDPDEQKREFRAGITMYLLNVATSFRVGEKDRNFKSEYIVSQMIMLACKSLGLNGVAYHSKQVQHEAFARAVGINLALFADFEKGKTHSPLCDKIRINESFNYALFKQLMPSEYECEYAMRYDLEYPLMIGRFDRQFEYKGTSFYDFDKFLFKTWMKI